MWNFNVVKTITYRHDYIFRIVFDDGLAGDVDFAGYLDKGPVFAPLREAAFFQSAEIANGTITWPNGADIAPETLYEKVASVKRSQSPDVATAHV